MLESHNILVHEHLIIFPTAAILEFSVSSEITSWFYIFTELPHRSLILTTEFRCCHSKKKCFSSFILILKWRIKTPVKN